MNRVRCLVFNSALGPLDYRVPDGMDVQPGSVVVAPLGPRQLIGVVWEAERLPGTEVPDHKLRPLLSVLPVPPLSAPLRRLIEWTADYYLASPASVARMALSSNAALQGGSTVTEYRLTGAEPGRLTPQRAKAIEALDGQQGTIRELAEIAGVSDGVLRGMASNGLLEAVVVDSDRPYPAPDPAFAAPDLSDQQAEVSARFVASVRAREFRPFLLDGVTGSGKTETYFEGVAAAIQDGRQVLVLLPEIALTETFLKRFEARFGVTPVTWHSSLKSSERRRAWRSVSSGAAKVVVGARSALFLPFANLGLIVVDEAHEISFKQDDGVRYNARDVAVMRARFESAPIILASATPALESLQMAEAGRYERVILPSRFGGATMPDIQVVDLRTQQPERGHWIAPPLVKALKDRLEKGEQSLLFLNRRGYAPLTLCRACGHRLECPNCAAALVEHRFRRQLMCHHCGHLEPMPRACPSCHTEGKMVPVGPGVERLAEEAAARFPQARIAILSSDLSRGTLLRDAIRDVAEGQYNLVIGTQLVAKGHHFPHLTLVGVVDADLALESSDPRGGERTWALMAQVAGRAGRGAKPGRALVQTYLPEHPLMQALRKGDRDSYLNQEKAIRENAGLPPYGRLAAIIISGGEAAEVERFARKLGLSAPLADGITVLGPAQAPIAMVRGRHRWRFLVKATRDVNVQAFLRLWLKDVKPRGSLALQVDVDPYNFL